MNLYFKLYNNFKKILSPKFCYRCFKYSKNYICKECLKDLNFNINFYCFECQQKIINKCRIYSHSKLVKFLISFGIYENEILKSLIITGKEGFKEIFIDLGKIISKFIKNYNFKDYYLAYVPITKTKLLQRGFNQSEIIAQILSKNLNLKIFDQLIKIKDTEDQSYLKYNERINNLKDVFKVKNKPPKKIILIDDIITTGTTLKECAKVLRENGTKEIIALTILK